MCYICKTCGETSGIKKTDKFCRNCGAGGGFKMLKVPKAEPKTVEDFTDDKGRFIPNEKSKVHFYETDYISDFAEEGVIKGILFKISQDAVENFPVDCFRYFIRVGDDYYTTAHLKDCVENPQHWFKKFITQLIR